MILRSNRLPRLVLALGLLAGLLAGCGGGGGGSSSSSSGPLGPTAPPAPGGGSLPQPPPGSGNGSLLILLIDKPTDQVSQINVFITALTVKPTNGPVQRITDNVGLVNLLALRSASQLLAAANVPAGSYEFIQIELDQSRSNVVELSGATKPLKIPSQEIKVLGGFTVMSGGQTTVTLDFKAEESLVHEGNGDWLLKPVIVMAGESHK